MKEKILHFGSYLLVAILSTVLTLTMVQLEVGLKPSKLDQLEDLIGEKFIGQAEPQTLEDAAAEAMIKATGDRWSYYIPANEYEAYREQSQNAYVGVGMTIQATEDSSGFLILEVVPGGPAEEAGMSPPASHTFSLSAHPLRGLLWHIPRGQEPPHDPPPHA